MYGCGVAVKPVGIRKDHGQMLIEGAQHSLSFSLSGVSLVGASIKSCVPFNFIDSDE